MQQEIIQRIARVGAMNAGVRPAPVTSQAGPAAAREGDQIKHKSFLGALLGAVTGALIGAAIFAAAGLLVVGTGGLATVAVLALGTAGTVAMGGVISRASGAVADFVDSVGPMHGPIVTASSNVYIEGKKAARAIVDKVACVKHSAPSMIAQGSESVFINDQPAARVGDKVTCGGTIKEGARSVYVGSGQGSYLDIAEEFSWWEKAILIAVEFLIPPSRGMIKGLGKLFTKAGRAAVVSGAKMGARQAGRIVTGKTFHCATGAFKGNKGLKRFTEAGKKFVKGDPIDVTTGGLVEQRTDIELGQTLPLRFTRTWAPDCEHTFALGQGWTDSFHQYAEVNAAGDVIDVTTQEGSALHFALPDGHDTGINPDHPDFSLHRHPEGWEVKDRRSAVSQWFTLRVTRDGRTRFLLTRQSDNNANTVALFHDKQGQLQRVTHSDGIELHLRWHDSGYLAEIVRVDGGLHDCLVRYRQNGGGYLTEADSLQFYHLFYDYNPQGLISRWHDNDQTRVDYHYDDRGRCIASLGAGGFYPVRFSYGPGVTRVSDSQGRITCFEYNEQLKVTAVEDPQGNRTRFIYDRFGNLLEQISPSGRITRLEYLKETGLVSAFYDAGGACWRYTYDDAARLTAMTDPLGQVWWQEYDEQGNAARFIAPDGTTTTLTRNAFGLVTHVADSDGNQQTARYDERQRLISLLDEESRALHLRYTTRDDLRSLSRSGGALWRFRHDNHRRVTVSDRPDSSLEHFTHDRHGNLTEYVDANGVAWRVEYGPFDLPVARTDGEGQRWQYRYDPDHLHLTEVINPQGERYRYRLNAAGQVTEEEDYAGTVWRYEYDEDGLCTAKTDATGQVTRCDYDAAGRLCRLRTPEGETRYQYDATGRVLSVCGPESELSFEYDPQGRVVRETQNGRVIRREYPDARTQVRHLEAPEDDAGQPALSTTFRTNRVGEWVSVRPAQHDEEHALRATRDEAGQDIRRTAGSGFILCQQYDLLGQVTRQRAGREPVHFTAEEMRDIPAPSLAGTDRRYEYDRAQNLVTATDERERLSYVVNGNGQVVSVSEGRQLQEYYRYDASGYRTRSQAGLPGRDLRVSNDDVYLTGHRLKQSGSARFEYDEAGRMRIRRVQREGYRPEETRFIWDSQSRLTALHKPGGEVWHYRYDPFGRRTEKCCAQRGLRTAYLWDGDTIAEIREYRQGVLQRIRHWVFDGWSLLAQQEWVRPTVSAMSTTMSTPEAGAMADGVAERTYTTHYAVCAPNGQPLSLFNSEGKVQWRRPIASLWGCVLGRQENAQLDPGLKFAGQQLDEESGLFYNRHRYYSPESGCYLTPDPIGLLGGENPYVYVTNPLTYVDPLGLTACSINAGKNFKDHFIRHKDILEKYFGKKYPKWKASEGAEFLKDIEMLRDSGKLIHVGQGTIKKGQPVMEIYRGEGMTYVSKKLANGTEEFVTLIESGKGMDLGIILLP